ncbi:S-layer homology domain-containing protein [Bacillus sp. FJAT-45350]|uniref:S-layer homology domain-containing protein n=1 Tax=Bacillus sp. FJAT-45350 TaxID=2011014 RepID=UPI000BB74BCD|nr:S-layer homology domain-containing protein [Bacillus sp. FJAT-45350]
MKRNRLLVYVAMFLVWIVFAAPTIEASGVYGQKVSYTKMELAPGVNYYQEHYGSSSFKRAINLVEMDAKSGKLDLYIPSPLNQLSTTTQQAINNTYDGHYVVGAINGAFFVPASGFPANLIIKNNRIINYGTLSADANGPINQQAAFGMLKDGQAHIGGYNTKLTFTHNGQSTPIASVNSGRLTSEMVLFTPTYHRSKPGDNPSPYATEFVITNTSQDASHFSFGQTVTGTVSEIIPFGQQANATIPEEGFVISANGQALATKLAGVQIGDKVTIQASIDQTWKDAEYMLATGPELVKDGKVAIGMNPTSSFAAHRQPRTAIGISKDRSQIFMVTVDGRQAGYSDGTSLEDLAKYLISKGAHHAINLDGGGSTTMAARLKGFDYPVVVNRPSDGSQRRVSATLQVISSTPPEPVTEPMLVIDSLDTVEKWQAESARATTNLAKAGQFEPIRIGNSSAKLSYDFTNHNEGTSAAYLSARNPIMLKGKPQEIGVWAFGEGHSHWLRGNIVDRNGNRHTINFTQEGQFEWIGWRYVKAKVPADIAYPIYFERIYLAQPNESMKTKGTVYFDQIEAIYSPAYKVERFKDVQSSHWAFNDIVELNNRNVITGFFDGSFKPNESITRLQAAIMLSRELKLKTDTKQISEFRDININHPYYDVIATIAAQGLITGKREGYFDPSDTLTRAEMAVIVERAYQLTGTSSVQFVDVPSTHWAEPAIQALAANQITGGYPDGTYRPSKSITRAEFSSFLYRVIR